MKSAEKTKAIVLRKKGWSIGKIAEKLSVSKSSVSRWVRHIRLTLRQIEKLSKSSHTTVVEERRRLTRLKNEKARRQVLIDAATREISKINYKELLIIGSMLYWGEGRKTQRTVQFSNSDPRMIKVMMKFFRTICGVSENRFRGHIHIHPHLDYKKAERFWGKISGIPKRQFFKTYRKANVASKHKRDNLPFGTFDIYICDVKVFLKIKGWIEGLIEKS